MDAEVAVAIEQAAKKYGWEPAALKAIAWVESAGTFFWIVGGKREPAIRPEGHKFHDRLEGPKLAQAVKDGLAHPRLNGVKLPSSWSGRYEFFRRMASIDQDAAICATSWGVGQVMGFHWRFLGFKSPLDMMQAARSGVSGQLDLMCRFIKQNPDLDQALKRRDWKTFARGYNGPAYKVNNYDVKMANAYAKFRKNPVDADVYILQEALKKLGMYDGNVDGLKGPLTAEAVREFQTAAGLKSDGNVSTITMEQINEYVEAKKAVDTKALVTKVGAAGAAIAPIAKPVAEAITSGDLADAIEQAQGIATAANNLLSMMSLGTTVTAIVLSAVVGGTLFVLLKNVGKDDEAKVEALKAAQ